MTEAAENTDDEMFENQAGSLTVDLTDVEESGFDVLPKGTYNCIVDEAEFKISQSGGNPMISLQWEVEDGEYSGRKLFSNIVFSEKAMPFAKRDISRLGLNHLLQGAFNPEDAADDFTGARARVRVSIEKYEGNDTNRVKGLLPAGGGNEFAEG